MPVYWSSNKQTNFPDTWMRLGSSRSFAKFLIWTDDEDYDLLNKKTCGSILDLHNHVTNNVTASMDDSNITYKLVLISCLYNVWFSIYLGNLLCKSFLNLCCCWSVFLILLNVELYFRDFVMFAEYFYLFLKSH